MQSLKFKKISICSEREQKAFSLEFHPHKTLLLGSNSTGKSTIIKSLFRAFDAEPTGDLRGWDYEAIVAVEFYVDNVEFTSIRRGDLKAIFQGEKLLGVTTSSSSWNEIFASVSGFKLQLMDRDEKFRTATPSMYFIPFYINQDGSFFGKWDTFKGIQQFDANAIPHSLEYFAGIRPAKFFELKGLERTAKSKLAETEAESLTLQRTRQRLKRTLKASPVKLTASGFEKEVNQLSRLATELGAKQDTLRNDIVDTKELARQLSDQIRLSTAALQEHEADFKSVNLATTSDASFRCPTCHAEHDASFHTFLGLAEDARELYRMRELLQHNLELVNAKLMRLHRSAATLKLEYFEVSKLLSARRGRLTFSDVVKSYGSDAVDTAFESELVNVQKDIGKTIEHIRELKLKLIDVMKTHDSAAPLNRFREKFKELLALAGVVEFTELDKWKLNKRPTDSGSPGPRSVVAYYGALWETMQDEIGRLPSPLVIDSPNQNAQDKKNLERLMAMLAGKTPSGAQVILCAEEPSETFNPDFVIELTDERALLKSELMSEIGSILIPMVDVALASLMRVAD